MLKRHLLATLCSVLLFTGWAGQATAHSALHHSTPEANAVIETAPASVQLWFSRSLEPAFSTVSVVDQQGQQIDKGDTAVKEKDAKLLEVSLPALTSGTYKVIWRIVALDGHKSKGEYNFTVK